MLDAKLTYSFLHTTPVYIKKLNEMGILSVRDLLYYFPRGYEDRTHVRKIHEIDASGLNVIKGKITNIENLMTRGYKKITRAEFEDEDGNTIEVVWFNQPHLLNLIKKGGSYILAGRVKIDFGRLTFVAPDFEEVKKEQVSMGRIIPLYSAYDTTERNTISSDWLRGKMSYVLPYAREEEEFLPDHILTTEQLMGRGKAIEEIHFPSDADHLEQARKRLSFDELFLLQLQTLKRKYDYQGKAEQRGTAIPLHTELIKKFIQELPFTLTDSQRIVTYQILKDMEKSSPMIRLLEGDVGSGKTIVATMVAYHTIQAGYQVVLMAPTEVLARQHYEKITEQLRAYHIPVELLIGSLSKSEKERITRGVKDGSIPFVIGTHALIQDTIDFKNLAFVVIDEQHRFGVEQRKKLASFGYPHVLHMTATPIPRTLALTIYGDQDLSLLKEMPQGRLPIITRVVSAQKRGQAYRFIESEILKGRQVYVICPLIEESEKLQVKAVTEEHKRLKSIFPTFHIGLLHGRLKSEEKEKVMHAFEAGEIQLLVSTTVIEVGIDVKNATIMMIEGADRFGLAQLHQLRGRVGRGEAQSYCFLFTESDREEVMTRLQVLEKTTNGFEVAEKDLQFRGMGEIYGLRQSGLPDMKMADLMDAHLVEKTREYATALLESDMELVHYPLLQKRIGKQEEWMVS
jgi:ATP-dependent DNA helicase RecG